MSEQFQKTPTNATKTPNNSSKDIINLEFLYYYYYKLTDIFQYNDKVLFYPSNNKVMINAEKWKILRNLCITILYIGILFTKPDWCDNKGLNIDNSCSRVISEDIEYFTVTNSYLDIFDFEIASWFLMLILIIYELVRKDSNSQLILVFCVLYVSDILLGFFYMNRVLEFKFNNILRLVFLVLYARFTRVLVKDFVSFLFKIKKFYILYFSIVIFIGMLLNVLYFDMEEESYDLYFSKLNFSGISESIYSSYTIFTFQNTLNLFSFTLEYSPIFIMFLVPLYFISLYLLLAFIIAEMIFFFSKHIHQKLKIKNFKYIKEIKGVFEYFKDIKGIVDYQKIDQYISECLYNSENIDLKLYSEKKEKEQKILERQKKYANNNYNTRHHKEFLKIQNEILFKIFFNFIDLSIAISPILIMDTKVYGLNNNWFFTIIILAGLSCIAPFLTLQFNLHKISNNRRKIYFFRIILSAFIGLLALVLQMQGRKPGLTLYQSNDFLFISFSILCFLKIVTLLDEILVKNQIIYDILKLCKQLVPFFKNFFIIYVIILIFYALVGRLLYGGMMNSASLNFYEEKYGIKMKDKYEYFNFNDTISSFLTLFVIVMQNNWIYVAEHMYSVQNNCLTTIYLVSFNLIVAFTCTSMILGVISRLVILYFDNDFEEMRKNFGKKKFEEEIQENESEIEDLDEYD